MLDDICPCRALRQLPGLVKWSWWCARGARSQEIFAPDVPWPSFHPSCNGIAVERAAVPIRPRPSARCDGITGWLFRRLQTDSRISRRRANNTGQRVLILRSNGRPCRGESRLALDQRRQWFASAHATVASPPSRPEEQPVPLREVVQRCLEEWGVQSTDSDEADDAGISRGWRVARAWRRRRRGRGRDTNPRPRNRGVGRRAARRGSAAAAAAACLSARRSASAASRRRAALAKANAEAAAALAEARRRPRPTRRMAAAARGRRAATRRDAGCSDVVAFTHNDLFSHTTRIASLAERFERICLYHDWWWHVRSCF